MKIDIGFAHDVIAKAMRKGIDQAEIFLRSSRSLSVEVKNQTVDMLTSSLSFGYSLRVLKRGRLGFSFSTDTDDADTVVRNACDAAGYSDEDVYLGLPEASGMADVLIVDEDIRGIREEDAVRKTMMLEKSAFDYDKRIRKVRKASGTFTLSETFILNSRQVQAGYESTSCAAQISAVAEQGSDSQIGWDFSGSRFLRGISFEDIGKKAAERAVILLGSRRREGTKADILLDNSVTVDFLGVLASSLSSEAVQKGRSLLGGRLNTKIISSKVNILDSGLIPGRLGSRPVDDEGVASGEKMLVQEGVLRMYLYNTYTANKEGKKSTGNAVRSGFSALPSVGRSNLFLEPASPGDIVRKENLFRSIDKGLYVVNAMGVHTANPVSGDFSIGVTGLWIEGGEVQYPVREAVISGNILEFFDRIAAIGDDLRFYGTIGGPSLVITGLDISA